MKIIYIFLSFLTFVSASVPRQEWMKIAYNKEATFYVDINSVYVTGINRKLWIKIVPRVNSALWRAGGVISAHELFEIRCSKPYSLRVLQADFFNSREQNIGEYTKSSEWSYSEKISTEYIISETACAIKFTTSKGR